MPNCVFFPLYSRVIDSPALQKVCHCQLAGRESTASRERIISWRCTFFPSGSSVLRWQREIHASPSTTGARTAPGRNLECTRGPQSGSGPHGKLGRKSLRGTAGRSLCGASWSCGRDRTAVGRKPLVALPQTLSVCTCAPVQNRSGVLQILPAYGLQDLWNDHRNPKNKSNPNTMCLQITSYSTHPADAVEAM
jgi:hypothetical protein